LSRLHAWGGVMEGLGGGVKLGKIQEGGGGEMIKERLGGCDRINHHWKKKRY